MELPKGATQKDLEAFIKNYINNPKVPPIKSQEEKAAQTCQNCAHWKQTGNLPYQGYCIVSCTCPTQILNGKEPTRWLPKTAWKNYLKKL